MKQSQLNRGRRAGRAIRRARIIGRGPGVGRVGRWWRGTGSIARPTSNVLPSIKISSSLPILREALRRSEPSAPYRTPSSSATLGCPFPSAVCPIVGDGEHRNAITDLARRFVGKQGRVGVVCGELWVGGAVRRDKSVHQLTVQLRP
jgi:hypothetical protein